MRGATRRRSHLIADRRLLLYFRRAALAVVAAAAAWGPRGAAALRCYAGDPTYQHECSSFSYCLLIISRTGQSQWSCDGNSYNQVSLCSNLGLVEDLITGSGGGSSSAVVFESPGVASMAGRHGESALDDDTLAEYYRRQEDSVRSALGLHDVGGAAAAAAAADSDDALGQPRSKFFFASALKNGGSAKSRPAIGGEASAGSAARLARAAGRSRAPPASIRYYTGQRRCFNGGDLGRICCCSSDFCNGAAGRAAGALAAAAIAVAAPWLRLLIT